MKKKNNAMKCRLNKHRNVLRQKLFFHPKKKCVPYIKQSAIFIKSISPRNKKKYVFSIPNYPVFMTFYMNHTMYIRRKLGRACHRRTIHQLFTSFSL